MTDSVNHPAEPSPRRRRRDIRERMEIARIETWDLLDDPDLAIFTIVRENGEPFAPFEAGQYTQLAFRDQSANDPRPRQFSIASAPHDLHALELYVILVRDSLGDGSNNEGVFTGTLWHHRPGDEVLFMPRPAGRFVPSRTTQRDLVCVGTGTGLAPFVSMARDFWHEYQDSGKLPRRLTILHGVSYASQLGYRADLETLAGEKGFDLLYVPVISRPEQDPGYEDSMGRGRLNDACRLLCGEPKVGRVDPFLPQQTFEALRERLTVAESTAYLCGNPGMISDVKDLLAGKGFNTEGRESQLITEDYW